MKRLFVLFLIMAFITGFSGLFAQEEEILNSGSELEDEIDATEEIAATEPDPYEFAEYDNAPSSDLEFYPSSVSGVPGFNEIPVPTHINNNFYLHESIRFTNLAQAAFEEGDYDSSIRLSDEAVRYARLSDEYVTFHLKKNEADSAIITAQERMNWASSSSVNAPTFHSEQYNKARASYNIAVGFQKVSLWDDALAFAHDVINTLAFIDEGSKGKAAPLPAQYTVREWHGTRDCLWNIAGWSWVYGDPHKWRLLYDANKSKLPTVGNPNLIEPGMVLDIPSIAGETREGMWNPANTYER